MRIFFLIILAVLFALPSQAQSYDMFEGDTINKIDQNRKRQGWWRIKADPKRHYGYTQGELVEQGEYNNSRKNGVWDKFYPGGSPKSEITYVSSRPKGPYVLYYDNGQIEEEGNWARTKNTGNFKRFHPNGKVAQEFAFSATGKRTGVQKYYHENGKLRLEGTWQEGLEAGEMKEYYENGDLMSVKNFSGGVIDKSSIEVYAAKSPVKDPVKKTISEGKEMNVTASKSEQPNQGTFDGNGYRKLFNPDKQIAKDGTFKRYRLMDGKQYKYDSNGLLVQIMIFKEGKYIGDGVIDEP